MKAFAIKFNDGYYWCGYNNSDKQLRKAVLYKSIKMAEETAKDCMTRVEYIRPYDNKIVSYEIIEITIAEGDLEQQLAIIKKALLKASKEAFGNKISFVSSNYPKKITNSEEYAEYLIFETESEVKNGN